jgi:hypothetical protein
MDRKERPGKTIEVLEKRAEKAESGDGAKGVPRHPVLYQINTRVWLTDLSGQLRDRLHRRGMRVMLDFVPNHTAPDHPWTHEHPDFYI